MATTYANPAKLPIGFYIGHGISVDGSKDPGVTYGKYTEADLVKPVIVAGIKHLKRCGFTKIYTDAPDNKINMIKQIEMSNKNNVKIHVAGHIDWAPAPTGTMPLYVSSAGKKLAEAMNKWVIKYAGLKTRGLVKRTDLRELNDTDMPAVIFELGSIDDDYKVIQKKADDIGKGLAHGICDYLNVKWVEEKTEVKKEETKKEAEPVDPKKEVKVVAPVKKETTKVGVTPIPKGQQLIDSARKVGDKVISKKLKYDGKSTYNTLNKSLKGKKTINCALFVTWCLQDMKVLPTNRRIWLGDKINGSGAATLKKRSSVSHPNKKMKDLKLQRGDILGWQWGPSEKNKVHTAIFDHYDKNGRPVIWTAGGYDIRVKKLCHKRRKYENLPVKTLVRLK